MSLAFHSETITLRSDEDMSDYNDYSYSYDYPGYDYTEHVVSSRTTLSYILCTVDLVCRVCCYIS